MYLKKTWYCGNVVEVEKVQTFKYKSKRTTRGPRVAKTPEGMKLINQRNATKNLVRIINTNFKTNDWHLVLTYTADNRIMTPEVGREDLSKFLRNLKAKYKRRGQELKYIATTEYGRKSLHHHLVINADVDISVIAQTWGFGRIHTSLLDNSGDYTTLAKYLIKQTSKTFQDAGRRVHKKRYCYSKNLIKPTPKIEVVEADSWRSEPKAPAGFYLIKDSVVSGVSDFTGFPYQFYKCVKLREDTNRVKKNKRKPHQRKQKTPPDVKHSTIG